METSFFCRMAEGQLIARLILFTVIAMSLTYVPFLADPAGLPRWLVLACFLLVAMFWQLFNPGLGKLNFIDPTFYLPILLLATAAISTLWALDSWAVATAWVKLWIGIGWFFCAFRCGSTLLRNDALWQSLLVAAGSLAIMGLFQSHGLQLGIDQIAPPAATFMNKNVAAQFAVGLTPAVLVALFRNDHWKWPGAAVAGLLLAYLWQVEARGAWLAIALISGGIFASRAFGEKPRWHQRLGPKTILMLIILFAALPRDFRAAQFQDPPLMGIFAMVLAACVGFVLTTAVTRRWWADTFPRELFDSKRSRVIGIGLAVMACFAILALVRSVAADPFLEGMNPDAHVNTIQVRMALYANSLQILADHPLFGIGWGQLFQIYPLYNHAWMATTSMSIQAIPHHLHQDLLQIAVELGLIGFAICLFWLLRLVVLGAQALRAEQQSHPSTIAAFAGLLAILVHSMVSFPLQQPASAFLFWVFAGLIGSLVNRQSSTPHRLPRWPISIWVAIHLAAVVCLAYAYLASQTLAKANRALAAGSLDTGYTLTQKAHRLYPGDPLPLDQLLTLASRYASNREGALKVANRFIQRYPNHPNGYFRKAYILKTAGRPKDALHVITRACELATADPEPWLLKGLIYRDLNDLQSARTCFEQVILRHRTHGPAQEQLRQLDALSLKKP